MKKLIITLTLFISTLSQLAFANESEPDYLEIDSAHQNFNYKANTIYFSGNVVVKQGQISIKADELFAETSNDDNTEKLIAKGKPATFSQIGAENGNITAQADEIEYLVEEQTLKLIGNATFKQGGSTVSSASIVFDLKAQQVIADSGDGTNERVLTRLKTKTSNNK